MSNQAVEQGKRTKDENHLTELLNDRLDSRLSGLKRASGKDRVELQGALSEIIIIMKELDVPMRKQLAEMLSKVTFGRDSRRS